MLEASRHRPATICRRFCGCRSVLHAHVDTEVFDAKCTAMSHDILCSSIGSLWAGQHIRLDEQRRGAADFHFGARVPQGRNVLVLAHASELHANSK
eukprot:2204348-Amphidinium_carterae.1